MKHLRDQELVSGAGLNAPHSLLYSQNALWRLQGGGGEGQISGKEGAPCLQCLLGPTASLARLKALGVSPPGGQGQAGDGTVRGGCVLGVQNP